jgi:hypothetical protein
MGATVLTLTPGALAMILTLQGWNQYADLIDPDTGRPMGSRLTPEQFAPIAFEQYQRAAACGTPHEYLAAKDAWEEVHNAAAE